MEQTINLAQYYLRKKILDNAFGFTFSANEDDDTHTASSLKSYIDTKVAKETGKGLSTNDYTTAEKNKLAGIANGATANTIDSSLSSSSTNAVQNKVINTALGTKVDKEDGKGLSTNDYTTVEKNKLSGIANGATANTIDSSLSSSSTNAVQNKVINTALGNKVDKETGKGLFSGSYNDLTNKPNLATVATSGSYNDLSNKPTIPSAYIHPTDHATTMIKEGSALNVIGTTANATQHTINDAINTKLSNIITGDVDLSGTHTHDWNEITNKPQLINVGYIDDDFNLYLGDISSTGTDVTASETIIQTGETTTIVGFGNPNTKLYFYEVFTPAYTLTATKSIMQTNDTATLSAKLKDATDGNTIKGQKVYFYEVFEPSITIISNKSAIQTNEYADISVKVKDSDGNLVKGETVYFYEKYEPTTINIKSNKSIVQTNEYADITATVKDIDGSLITRETVYFHQKT